MPFVKLDRGLLDSSLWPDRDARDLFVTALLMADPHEARKDLPQIAVDSLAPTGFVLAAGWYGFVAAAGAGIIHRAGIDQAAGIEGLRRLGEPDPDSRSSAAGGRRLVRVEGGYIVVNFDKYRQKDHTAAERSRRFRDRKKRSDTGATPLRVTRTATVTEAEAEAEADKAAAGAERPLPAAAPVIDQRLEILAAAGVSIDRTPRTRGEWTNELNGSTIADVKAVLGLKIALHWPSDYPKARKLVLELDTKRRHDEDAEIEAQRDRDKAAAAEAWDQKSVDEARKVLGALLAAAEIPGGVKLAQILVRQALDRANNKGLGFALGRLKQAIGEAKMNLKESAP
jgi:hypothetical protein